LGRDCVLENRPMRNYGVQLKREAQGNRWVLRGFYYIMVTPYIQSITDYLNIKANRRSWLMASSAGDYFRRPNQLNVS
jgi:hypothetical protein